MQEMKETMLRDSSPSWSMDSVKDIDLSERSQVNSTTVQVTIVRILVVFF